MESPILWQLIRLLFNPMVEVIEGMVSTVPADAVLVFDLDMFKMLTTVDECRQPVELRSCPSPHPSQAFPQEQRTSGQPYSPCQSTP